MTMAICLRCGVEKFGAWTPCPKCRFIPNSTEERAKALLLTDFYSSADGMREVSEAIIHGEEIEFDPEAIEELQADIIELTKDSAQQSPDAS